MRRSVSRATTATTWAPRTIRVTSTAGRQVISPSRMTNAPTGRALMPKPPPEPDPVPSGLSPLPPPPPPCTLATGITVSPFRSYGSPNTRFTVSVSRACAMTSCTCMACLLPHSSCAGTPAGAVGADQDSQEILASPGSERQRSVPAPPSAMSFPRTPSRTSIVSFPARPRSAFGPPAPVRASAKADPTAFSMADRRSENADPEAEPVERFTRTPAPDQSYTTVSEPAPPEIVFDPWRPARTSAPPPPLRASGAGPPIRRSLPPWPFSVSIPPNADPSIVLSPPPPVSAARSTPDSASDADPKVSAALLRVKLTSPVSDSWSLPAPPFTVLAPRPPVSVSAPSPPIRVSAPLPPMRRPAPPVSMARSTPASESTAEPNVRFVFDRLKLTSPDSTTTSLPAPPLRVFTPPAPESRSSPSPPASASGPLPPIRTSLPARPKRDACPPNPNAFSVFAPDPPVSVAISIPDSASMAAPNASEVFVSVKLTNTSLAFGAAMDALSGIEMATLTGGSGANTLNAFGFGGQASLFGLAGNDVLIGGSGPDALAGGDGDDRLSGAGGVNTLSGGAGSDVVVESGDVNFNLSNTNLTFGSAVDSLAGIERAMLTGGAGANTLTAPGFSGAATLNGMGGADLLIGGNGADTLIGGDGADTLTGGRVANTVNRGAGNDQLSETGDVNFTLSNAALTFGSASDALSGVERAALTGGGGDNTIDGSAFGGMLTLNGQGGSDLLIGVLRPPVGHRERRGVGLRGRPYRRGRAERAPGPGRKRHDRRSRRRPGERHGRRGSGHRPLPLRPGRRQDLLRVLIRPDRARRRAGA